MNLSLHHLRRFLPLLLLLGLATVPQADAVDVAISAFQKAARRSDVDAKRSALAELVQLGDLDAHEVLQQAVGKASLGVHAGRGKVRRLTAAVERKRRLVLELELRVKHDAELADSLSEQERQLKSLQSSLSSARKSLAKIEPWLHALRAGLAEFALALKPADRKKYTKSLLKAAGKEQREADQIGTLEILGQVGQAETPKRLIALMNGLEGARVKLKRALAKEKRAIAKAERELGKKQDKGAASVRPAMQQYRRLVRDSTKNEQQVAVLSYQLDAASEATGRVLSRLVDDELAKALRQLAVAIQKNDGSLKRRYVAAMTQANTPAVRAVLVAQVTAAKPDQVDLIRGLLVGLGSPAAATDGFAVVVSQLDSEHWQVRAAAINALRGQRQAEAIPLLIERLTAEEGRMRTDLAGALTSLTGKSLRSSYAAWSRWWKAEGGPDFKVAAVDAKPEGALSAEEELGVTFFGIRTESQRVLFVLDVSGSMDFAMIPRDNPTDDPRQPYDKPQGTEQSRLEVARQQLVGALGGLGDGGLFNLVLYASDVWTWEDELVEMDTDVRSDVLRFVDSLEADGSTNLFGALMRAFDIAGVEEDDEWSEPLVDTIFVLSDGKPSIGVLTVPEQILNAVRERNQGAGIVIHAIGLSGAQDAAFLSGLAEQNGGQYVGK